MLLLAMTQPDETVGNKAGQDPEIISPQNCVVDFVDTKKKKNPFRISQVSQNILLNSFFCLLSTPKHLQYVRKKGTCFTSPPLNSFLFFLCTKYLQVFRSDSGGDGKLVKQTSRYNWKQNLKLYFNADSFS